MEKNMTIGMRSGAGVVAAVVQFLIVGMRSGAGVMMALAQLAIVPVEQLRGYYGRVLERELNMRQTWLLIQAQLAFACAVLPVESPLLLRAACCGWFLYAVLRCRVEL